MLRRLTVGSTRTHVFALALLPRALTLSLNLTPMDRLVSVTKAEETQTISTAITFDVSQPMPLKFDTTAPKIEKGTSRAEDEAKQAAEKAKSIAKTTVVESTNVSEAVATPDLSEKRALAQSVAAQNGIDWKLLEAVWQIESGKAWKTGVQSYVGATGPMQFMPGTWKHYGTGDITYAPDALQAGAKLLAANGAAEGNIESALFSYNHAQWYVDKVKNIMASI